MAVACSCYTEAEAGIPAVLAVVDLLLDVARLVPDLDQVHALNTRQSVERAVGNYMRTTGFRS